MAYRSSCPRDDRSSRTRVVGETAGQRVSRRAPNSAEEVSSPSNHGSSAPSRPDARNALLASLTRRARQRDPARLVGARPGHNRCHQVVDAVPAQRRPGETHAQTHIFVEGSAAALEGAAQELAHASVPLDPPHRHRLLDADLRFRGNVGDRRLHDCFFAERGEDLCDVTQEGPTGTEHQHAVAAERRVVVEEIGRTVQPDGGLAGTRPTLHGEELVEGGADDLVLFSLDGGDDVEHLAGACPFQLGQESITATQPGSASGVLAAEEVVGHGHHRAAINHDLATTGEPERVLGAGPVEGHGHGGPPVHDDRIGSGVLHVATTDMPGGPLLIVDPSKEEGSRAVSQERHPPRQGGEVVQVGIPGGDEITQEEFGPLTHGPERRQGMLEIGLLSGNLWIGRRSGGTHRMLDSGDIRAKSAAQKSPVIPGTLPDFQLPNNPFSWYFAFSSAWTLNL